MPKPIVTNNNGNITIKSDNLFIQPNPGKPRGIRIFDENPNQPGLKQKPILEVDSFETLSYTGTEEGNIVMGVLPPSIGKVDGVKSSPVIKIDTGAGADLVMLVRASDVDKNSPSDPAVVLSIDTGDGADVTGLETLPGSTISHSSSSKDGESDLVAFFTEAAMPSRVVVNSTGNTGTTELAKIENPKVVRDKVTGKDDQKKEISISRLKDPIHNKGQNLSFIMGRGN